jgi:hypothetical protein
MAAGTSSEGFLARPQIWQTGCVTGWRAAGIERQLPLLYRLPEGQATCVKNLPRSNSAANAGPARPMAALKLGTTVTLAAIVLARRITRRPLLAAEEAQAGANRGRPARPAALP